MNNTQDLLSAVYSSNARTPFDETQLEQLLAQSREANSRNELTGMLLYRGGRFVQVLEGPTETVRALLRTIEADDRHTDMRLLMDESIAQRHFAEWTMGYEPMAEPREPVPAGFRSTFDDLDGDDAGHVIRAVRELSLWFRARSAGHTAPQPVKT